MRGSSSGSNLDALNGLYGVDLIIAYEFEHIASGGAMTSGVALHVRYLDGGTGVDHQYRSADRLRDSESAARKRDWQSSYRVKEW